MAASRVNIQSPKGWLALGRHRNKIGVFIIRQGLDVLYVGWSETLGTTCVRYFSKGGSLEQYDKKRVTFELIFCHPKIAARLTSILKRHFNPKENIVYNEPRMGVNERKTRKRLLAQYINESFIEEVLPGEHQSDTLPLKQQPQ